jgi:hypothetical protein
LDNHLEPLVRKPLAHNTSLFSGDDSGYRTVPSEEGWEPMVELQNNTNIIVRPVYAGYSPIDGQISISSSLPGTGETMYVRRAVAECLEGAANFIAEQSGYQLIVVDGFRNYQTQAAGFSRLFIESLGENRSDIAKYDALLSADKIFSFVDIDASLVADSPLTIEACTKLTNTINWDTTPKQIRQEMLTWAANMALYQQLTKQDFDIVNMQYWWEKLMKHGTNLFQYNNNAHAWGGAIDVLLWEKCEIGGCTRWVPVNHIPFDYMWSESAIDFLENEENWDSYRTSARKEWAIRRYLMSIHINPDNIDDEQFWKWRDAIRLLTNTMTSMGATYYYNENWHFNVPNIIRNPKTQVIEYSWACAWIQQNTWNSCHAILTHGSEWVQTFTGIGAHKMLKLT